MLDGFPGPVACQAACFGEGPGRVHYRDVNCPPGAESISDCSVILVGTGVCSDHSRDVGAICSKTNHG